MPRPSPRLRFSLLVTAAMVAFAPGVGAVDDTPTSDARQVLDAVARARGGPDLLERLLEVRRRGTMILPAPDGEREVPVSLIIRPPDAVRVETGGDDRAEVRVLSGGEAFRTVAGGDPAALDDDARAALTRMAWVDEAFLVRHVLEGRLRLGAVGPAGRGQLPEGHAAAGGVALTVVPPTGAEVQVVVPEGGGLPMRVDYDIIDPAGQPRSATEVFGEWRVVQGVPFPFEVLLYLEGRLVTIMRYDTIETEMAPAAAS